MLVSESTAMIRSPRTFMYCKAVPGFSGRSACDQPAYPRHYLFMASTLRLRNAFGSS
jgi:hypothetical protein